MAPPVSLSGPVQNIAAFTIAGNLAYGFANTPLRPVVGVRFGYTSGDDDPSDRSLGTYRPASPPGRYFAQSSPFGPGSLIGVKPYITLNPDDRTSITPAVNIYWRDSVRDGLFSPPGFPVRGGAGSEGYVGWEAALSALRQIDWNTSASLDLGYYFASDFFDDNPPARDTFYLRALANFEF